MPSVQGLIQLAIVWNRCHFLNLGMEPNNTTNKHLKMYLRYLKKIGEIFSLGYIFQSLIHSSPLILLLIFKEIISVAKHMDKPINIVDQLSTVPKISLL